MSEPQEQRNEAIGALLGLACAVATAGYLLFIREAMAIADRSGVVFAMLLGAALLNSAVALSRRDSRTPPTRKYFLSALVLATLTILANLALATSLPLLGPGVTSTLLQTQVLVVAFLAWVFLKEAVGIVLLVGAVIAAGGFALFALPGQGSPSLSGYGLLAGSVTTLCFAAMLVWTRKVIHDLDPVSLNAGRLWLAVVAMALMPGVLRSALAMPGSGWALTLGAAAGGPFIGRLAIMYALRYISAAKCKLWGMLSPVFAFLFVYLIYGTSPSAREVLGGALIVCGVLLPVLAGLRRREPGVTGAG